jgi:predicted RND superfamily exporter protein
VVIDQKTQADHAMTAVTVTLIGIVFVLDLLLYVIPPGLTTWIRRLLPISAGVCSVLMILGYFFSEGGDVISIEV